MVNDRGKIISSQAQRYHITYCRNFDCIDNLVIKLYIHNKHIIRDYIDLGSICSPPYITNSVESRVVRAPNTPYECKDNYC